MFPGIHASGRISEKLKDGIRFTINSRIMPIHDIYNLSEEHRRQGYKQ